MRQLSIRTQMLLALNGTTLVLGLAAGWVSLHLVNRAAERRAVQEPARNTARLIAALRLPLTGRLAHDLQRLTGCETAFVTATGTLVASTLPELSASAANEARPDAGKPTRISASGRRYVAGVCDIPGARPPARVILLASAEVLTAEGHRVGWRIAWATLAVVLLTTVAGIGLAQGVTRSLRRLAAQAASMTASLTASAGPASQAVTHPAGQGRPRRFAESGAPTEVTSLARSFNQLLSRLESARQDLEHAARLAAVGQLASAVVHELRNPLCGIAMNARILADEAACRGERDPSLDLIAREVERMDLYLGELLLLARPSDASAARAATPAGRPATSLRAAVGSVSVLLAGRCRHAGVEWINRLPDPDLPVAMPDVALRQVLLNLALNALDAMPNGGRVAVAADACGEGWLRISVSDTGSGLQPTPGQDIFAPFVSTKPGGSGLGLYVSRQMVERSGGRIGFAPAAPQGTTFWVELPQVGRQRTSAPEVADCDSKCP